MKQIGIYARVRMAFVVIGIAVMSAIGGATFAHTHDMTATTLALLASAIGLAVFGRRALRWWWSEMMLGLDDPGEPSAEYEGTTRAQARTKARSHDRQGRGTRHGNDHGSRTLSEGRDIGHMGEGTSQGSAGWRGYPPSPASLSERAAAPPRARRAAPGPNWPEDTKRCVAWFAVLAWSVPGLAFYCGAINAHHGRHRRKRPGDRKSVV